MLIWVRTRVHVRPVGTARVHRLHHTRHTTPFVKFFINGDIDWQLRSAVLLRYVQLHFQRFESNWEAFERRHGGNKAAGLFLMIPHGRKVRRVLNRVPLHSGITVTGRRKSHIVIPFFFLWNAVPAGYPRWPLASCSLSVSISQMSTFLLQTTTAQEFDLFWVGAWQHEI